MSYDKSSCALLYPCGAARITAVGGFREGEGEEESENYRVAEKCEFHQLEVSHGERFLTV